MSPRFVFGALTSIAVLAGCQSTSAPPPQPDYSGGYSYVATGAGGSSKGLAGSVLAPDACLNNGIDDDNVGAANIGTVVSGVGTHLAPGCANAYNLQRMVESERDLLEGRRMGPAPAAPSTRAARRYLHGDPATPDAVDTGLTTNTQ